MHFFSVIKYLLSLNAFTGPPEMPTGPVVASTPVAPNPYQGRPIGPAYASIPSALSARPDLTFASTMPVVTSAPPSYVMAPGEVPPPPQSKLILRACIP